MRLGGDGDDFGQVHCAEEAAATWWDRNARPRPILFRFEGLLMAPALDGL